MFQSFDVLSAPENGSPRLATLREALKACGLTGFIVPRADEFQNEYIPACSDRLRWLTGFTGSAGTALALLDRAALITDGRYVLQASQQLDSAAFQVVNSADTSLETLVETALPADGTLGIDPWLHTADQLARLSAAAKRAGGRLQKLERNLIDTIWHDRPAPPCAKVEAHPLSLAGEDSADKLERVRQAISRVSATHLVVTQTDAIAWLFNIRGGDVAHAPLVLAYAVIGVEGKATLFIDRRKIDGETQSFLQETTKIVDQNDFSSALSTIAKTGARIIVDPSTAAVAIADLITSAGGVIMAVADPIEKMKAPKNAIELAGTRAAHVRDGAALARFLAWFERTAPDGQLDEIMVATALEGFRTETGRLRDIAFPSIAGAGPNGAIIHYRPTIESNRKLDRNSLFLIDSGGQYRDGTTDVTRTLAVGSPTHEMRRRWTLVLKGLIAISRARFPKGTSGQHIDALARQFLWLDGLDFDHGTGHGVGCYLSVHEGPQRIAKTPSPALEPGMIISNEPGFYKPGAYGIRLENLLIVTPAQSLPFGERAMMGFETLTLAPFDRRCLEIALLDPQECAWLDAYHQRVRDELRPHVDTATADWLDGACARL